MNETQICLVEWEEVSPRCSVLKLRTRESSAGVAG